MSSLTTLSLALLLVWLGLAHLAVASTENIEIPYTVQNAPLIIQAAAHQYGIDGDSFLAVAKCESQLKNQPKHWDVNGYAYGVFQFHSKTFYTNAKLMGLTNPDITDPFQQTIVAAWMFKHGKSGAWTCTKLVGASSP